MNNGAVTLVYDGDGNRVAKTVGGVTTQYLVDDLDPTGYAQVVEELTNGAPTATYVYGQQRISQTRSGTTSYYGYDGLGSVRTLANVAGTVTDTYDYDAWGNIVNQTGNTPNAYRYRGEQYDPDLNLYYQRARYFNPSTGRFMTRDTYPGILTAPVTLHRYLYASADPVNHSDPSGWLVMYPPAPPATRQGSGSGLEYVLILAAVALPFAAIFADTVLPSAYDIRCVWTRAGGFAAIAFTASLGIYVPGVNQKNPCDPKPAKCKSCKKCIPPVGELSYTVHYNQKTPHYDKKTHTWVPSTHWHLWRMEQNPPQPVSPTAPPCLCRWKKLKEAGPYPPPPPGVKPQVPAAGGGCAEWE